MKTDSLANKAFVELRKRILSKQLPMSTRLKEDEWAQRLGVSRMAIREALTRLLGEDLVMIGDKGGYFVKPVLATEVSDIRQLREVMETGAMRLAVGRMNDQQFESLEKICDDYKAMVERGYYNGALEADMKFHETLVEYSGNKKLLQVYRSSHIPYFHEKLSAGNHSLEDYAQTDAEHREILKALQTKDLTLAEQILQRHFARGAVLVTEVE